MAGRLAHLEPLLNECISLGIEVVIVHDEQDSKTGDELREILTQVNSKMITLVTRSLYSPGKARNLGISIAQGDWICFWDSDDKPIPKDFLEMVRQATNSSHEVALGKFRLIKEGARKIYGNSETEIGRMPGIWRFAFKREFLDEDTFPDYRMGEDQVFLGRILVRTQKLFRYQGVVYEYNNDNLGQLTQSRNAIQELRFAVQDMLTIVSCPEGRNSIAPIFLSRQILTLLKEGTPRSKFKTIEFVTKGVKSGGKGFLVIFLKECTFAMKNLFSFGRNH
jgi:glycosyltransferase involved in cell wall biosynthesis